MGLGYINNQAFEYREGETVLTFLRRHLGKDHVPTLCEAEYLDPFGACRMCSVEIARTGNGATKMVASCHTPMQEGLFVFPDSKPVQRLRKNILELVLTDHPLECLTCQANNNCELQSVASQVGIYDVRYPEGANHLHREKDLSHPYMVSDLSKCINCYQCVRACDEVQGQFVLSMAGRGFDAHIIKGMDTTFAESDCVSCGACSQACPTAAISDVFQPATRRATEKTRTVCTYCGVGCNLEVATRDTEVLGIRAAEDAAVNQGHTCLKGRYAFRFYNHPDRLRTPLIRRNGNLEPATWDEAYDYIADKLKAIRAKHGPDAIAGISSSRCTNEENYLMQKFIRAVIGTNNIDGCARICHSPTALGMQRTFGTGAATNSIEDLKHTNCILVIGANPTEAHPVTGAKIKQRAMKGVPMIVIDPRRTELARHATIHLQLRPGTNVALLNMMMHYILKDGLEDKAFIDQRLDGYDDFREGILSLDLDRMEEICGVDKQLVRKAAHIYAKAPRAMSFHGLGVTEHYQGTFGVMLIADLAMITGNIGKPGVGVNPLRGQNNVQGAADMGVQPHQGPGYFDVMNPDLRGACEEVYGHPLPSKIGYTSPRMFDAAIEGKLKALWIMGEDVVQTEPNSSHVRKALQSLELFVVQELFPSETTSYAHVVLPASSFLEKSGTFTNGERRVQRVNRAIEPLPGTKPDGQIMVDIMNRMGYDTPDYDPALVLQEISRVVPFFRGITWDRLGTNGLQWPVAEDGTDTRILHADSFKLGRGRLHYIDFEETRELKENAEEFPLILTTNRRLEHYNCGSMTRLTSNSILLSEDFLLINPEDARARAISNGEMVVLKSPRGLIEIRSKLTDQVKPGVLSATFHFPDIMLNDVTSSVVDSQADCPEYKVVAVQVEKKEPVPA